MNRREFVKMSAVVPLARFPMRKEEAGQNPGGKLTDVPGVKVGHFTDSRRPTGCTVVLCEKGAVAGVDVRGSAPGTRETDLLDPVNTVQQIHGLVLSGGSAFGLETAGGVMRYLEERGIGFETSVARVPIVPAAILFDLGVGDASIRPDAEAGYQAAQRATDGAVPEGNVGAGAGATVGKFFGVDRAMKGGLGTTSLRRGKLVVAALAAVNCVGDVLDHRSGKILAGARDRAGKGFRNTIKSILSDSTLSDHRNGENTTLLAVATNGDFNKAEMTKIARMSHDGMARAINPAHLPSDGDTVFALSTGGVEASLSVVGAMAAEATALAIQRGVLEATSVAGFPAHRDL